MKSDESSDFRWSAGALQNAVNESVKSACKTFGLEWDSFHTGGERIGAFEYVDITRQTMFKWNFGGSSGTKPSFIEIAFGPTGQDDWLTIVTTSGGFSEAYILPGDDETAFSPVRNCVSDRLKEIKANG